MDAIEKKAWLLQGISEKDKRVFERGLCHVFADELATEQQAKKYSLSLMREGHRDTGPTAALYVFWRKREFVLDIHGWRDGLREVEWRDGIHACERGVLFERGSADATHNCYNMLLDEDLLAKARAFAREIIDSNPTKYRLGFRPPKRPPTWMHFEGERP
jgi:hypothetical protein